MNNNFSELFKTLPKKNKSTAICEDKFVSEYKNININGLTISERIEKFVKLGI